MLCAPGAYDLTLEPETFPGFMNHAVWVVAPQSLQVGSACRLLKLVFALDPMASKDNLLGILLEVVVRTFDQHEFEEYRGEFDRHEKEGDRTARAETGDFVGCLHPSKEAG